MGGGGVGYSASSSASSGVHAQNTFDSGGFNVNYGTQQVVPSWVWMVAAGVALLFVLKKVR